MSSNPVWQGWEGQAGSPAEHRDAQKRLFCKWEHKLPGEANRKPAVVTHVKSGGRFPPASCSASVKKVDRRPQARAWDGGEEEEGEGGVIRQRI